VSSCRKNDCYFKSFSSTKFTDGSNNGVNPDCIVKLDIYALKYGNAMAGALTLGNELFLNSSSIALKSIIVFEKCL
jgi:hypothetical protein